VVSLKAARRLAKAGCAVFLGGGCFFLFAPFRASSLPRLVQSEWCVVVPTPSFLVCFQRQGKTEKPISHRLVPVPKRAPDKQTKQEKTQSMVVFFGDVEVWCERRVVVLSVVDVEGFGKNP